MKTYLRNNVPKGFCFSNAAIKGAYYEDTEKGEARTWHKYDQFGNIEKSSVIPPKNLEYYLSDRYGDGVQTEEVTKYQYMGYDNILDKYFVTDKRYLNIGEAQEAYRCESNIEIIEIVSESREIKTFIIKKVWKYQWLYRVTAKSHGFECAWQLTGLLTEKEAEKKLKTPANIHEYRKLANSGVEERTR